MVLLSLDVINLGYNADGFGEPLKNFDVGQKVLNLSDSPSVRRWLGECPVPLPADYVRGLDEITQFVTAKPPSYLRGEYRSGGWWYFYLYSWGVKLPLGTWLIVFLAFASCLLDWFLHSVGGDRRSLRFLLAIACALFVFVTMKSGAQFVRYTLPTLPFVLIWASQVAADCDRRPDWFRAAIVGGVLWTTASSLLVFPHSLSYFNELTGGPRHGYRHLIDDSYDWGQDLLNLRHWLDAHPEANPIKLAYFGWTDPRTAGIEFELPPLKSELLAVKSDVADVDESSPVREFERVRLTPGWYAVSVGHSHGGPWIRIHDGSGHEVVITHGDFDYFREIAPTASAGYSIRIFHLNEETINHIMETLGPR